MDITRPVAAKGARTARPHGSGSQPDVGGRLWTADEIFKLPEDDRSYELVKGVLHSMPPPGSEHGDIAMELGARIRVFAIDDAFGRAFAAETGLLLETNPDTVRAADASFVWADRLPERLPERYLSGAPDLAVEVRSPWDRPKDLRETVADWLRHGARLVWLVEPRKRTVTVYRADGSSTVLGSADVVDGEDVLPGFQYRLTGLFRN